MSSDAPRRTISSIYDAALVSDLWPTALKSVMDEVGAVGAGYGFFNKWTEQIEWLSQSGPLVELEADYFSYYHAIERYRPMLEAVPAEKWLRISECLPETVLRRDEWYNDYLLKAGIDDAVGARLFENQSHAVYFGIHHGMDQPPFAVDRLAALRALVKPLGQAARLHVELHSLGWKSAVALQALEQLAAAVIVADSDGRVIQTNPIAERVLQRGDGLTIRGGKLGALRVLDSARLETAIAMAAAEENTGAAIGRMRVRRHDGRLPYVLTVAPLGAELTAYGRPLAMIVLTDPDECSPSERDLAEFFRLSPAESRLAVALLAGKKLSDVAMEFGVQITTLRTQLSSILRKTGVTRQVDLIRLLSNVPVIPSGAPEIKSRRRSTA
jgi:DNA-binding CsgD family transcriptional regulator/PAS domain-containing protein